MRYGRCSDGIKERIIVMAKDIRKRTVSRMHIWDGRVNEDAFDALRKYCEGRNYKCKGCSYRIDKLTAEHGLGTTCIFANCPCSWDNCGKGGE